jgi:DNA primase
MMEDRSLGEVLERLDIGAYLDREGIDYRETHGSSGAQYNVRECPCCGTSKWKVFLNVESGLGNCFSGSCGAKFNKFTFIRAHAGLDNSKTAAHIFEVAKEMGWRPPRKSTVAVSTVSKTIKLPYSLPIPINGRNLAYLENRGISKEIAEYFHLRFCHKGLLSYEDNYGNTRYQDFGMRIVIPVFDLDGQLVSFQARDITGTAEKKYLFPNGFASTGVHLFNGHNVHNTERIIVGEGVFDVAAQKIALDTDPDLRDVVPVGTFGKHLSFGSEQSQLAKFMELQKRGVREVTMMWDGEVKALDDAIVAGEMLKGVGMKVKVAMLPADKDPNEVPPDVVCRSFWSATPLTPASAIKLRMLRRSSA